MLTDLLMQRSVLFKILLNFKALSRPGLVEKPQIIQRRAYTYGICGVDNDIVMLMY